MASVTVGMEEWETGANRIRSLRSQLSREQRHQDYVNSAAGDLLSEQLDWAPSHPLSVTNKDFEGEIWASVVSDPNGAEARKWLK